MPRGSPRDLLTFRCSAAGHTWVADLMAELRIDKTSVMRGVMAVAKNHEPELKALLRERKEEP